MDKVFLSGNLGRDPELRYTQSGTAVCDFSVGVRRSVKQGDKFEKATVWYKCTAWGKTAESVNNYLAKGDGVTVEGELQFDKATGSPKIWIGKNDGLPRTSFEVRVIDWEITNHRSGKKPNQQPQQPNSQWTNAPQQGWQQQGQQPQAYQQQSRPPVPPAPPAPQYPQGDPADEIPF